MSWNPLKDIIKYNPITVATDFVTGGRFSEDVLGTDDSLYEDVGELGQKIEGAVDDISGRTAQEAAEEASRTQAGAMMQQLEYLKEINKLPQEYKEQALTRLNEIYGGGEEGRRAQQDIIEQAKASPYYQGIIGGREAGEDAILRHAGATGGLRSGNVQSAMYDYNTQLENKALSNAYGNIIGGIQGLAGLPTNEQQIGQVYSDIGATKAAGIIGGAQARQMGTQNMLNLGLGLGQLGLGFAAL